MTARQDIGACMRMLNDFIAAGEQPRIWEEFNKLNLATTEMGVLTLYVRFTYWDQRQIPEWSTMLETVRQEVIRRGYDADRVLRGLYDPLDEVPAGVNAIRAMTGLPPL